MFHYNEPVQDRQGNGLVGYFIGLVTPDPANPTGGSQATIYADANGTAIVSVSGVANLAKVDENGMVSLYVAEGSYHIDLYGPDGTTILNRYYNIPMLSAAVNTTAASSVGSRALMAAISSPVSTQSVYLSEAGREGTFVFSTANHATDVTNDPPQAIYVAPSSDTTGASGAWVRKYPGRLRPQWFGVKGDGTTDDAAAMQKAFDYSTANGIGLSIPGADYKISAAVNINNDYFDIEGDGWGKTRFLTTAATPAIVIKGRWGRLRGVGTVGQSLGTYGIVCQNANNSRIEHCAASGFIDDGLLFDTAFGGGSGLNDIVVVSGGRYYSNTGCGARIKSQADNNGISFVDGFESVSNGSHGLLVKAVGTYVGASCHFEGNTGYGIQLGEDADAGATSYSTIDGPWIETNTAGGIHGSANSQGNLVRIKPSAQTYSRTAGATDSIQRLTTGGLYRVGSLDDSTFVQVTAQSSDTYVNAMTAAGTGDVNLNLGGLNNGIVKAFTSFQVTAGSMGYGAGAGGAVTQATSRTTGVTLNKACGQITLFSAAGSATWQTFTVTNSLVAATDTIRVSQASGADKYMIHVTHVAAGSFDVTFATTGGTTTEQPVFNFSVVKAVAA